MLMTVEITRLQSPMDGMLLIHKALRAQAARVEKVAARLEAGDSLQSFRLAFNTWAAALVYHLDQEDRHLSTLLTGSQPPPSDVTSDRVSASANGRSPTTAREGKLAMIALEQTPHQDLTDCVEGVLTVLNKEIGKTSIITRTRQHLHRQVVALGISQEDHLETQETFILPLLRQRLSDRQQLRVCRALLIDEEAQDSRWVFDWVCQQLEPADRKWLDELQKRFSEQPADMP